MILNRELLKRLGNDLLCLDNYPDGKKELTGGIPELKESILNYSTREFAKSFGFQYGSEAKPPHAKQGGKIMADSALFTGFFPLGNTSVESLFDNELFP